MRTAFFARLRVKLRRDMVIFSRSEKFVISNVVERENTFVRAVADIKSGSELLTNYGDAYREKYFKKII